MKVRASVKKFVETARSLGEMVLSELYVKTQGINRGKDNHGKDSRS